MPIAPTKYDFNPRSPHGERRRGRPPDSAAAAFQSTLPARGATGRGRQQQLIICLFQSTLPARGATGTSWRMRLQKVFQSTLPARGATALAMWCVLNHGKFQSTLPARGATNAPTFSRMRVQHFNPRSPHGERPLFPPATPRWQAISIHAPRTGSDLMDWADAGDLQKFQSTLPARGATG